MILQFLAGAKLDYKTLSKEELALLEQDAIVSDFISFHINSILIVLSSIIKWKTCLRRSYRNNGEENKYIKTSKNPLTSKSVFLFLGFFVMFEQNK